MSQPASEKKTFSHSPYHYSADVSVPPPQPYYPAAAPFSAPAATSHRYREDIIPQVPQSNDSYTVQLLPDSTLTVHRGHSRKCYSVGSVASFSSFDGSGAPTPDDAPYSMDGTPCRTSPLSESYNGNYQTVPAFQMTYGQPAPTHNQGCQRSFPPQASFQDQHGRRQSNFSVGAPHGTVPIHASPDDQSAYPPALNPGWYNTSPPVCAIPSTQPVFPVFSGQARQDQQSRIHSRNFSSGSAHERSPARAHSRVASASSAAPAQRQPQEKTPVHTANLEGRVSFYPFPSASALSRYHDQVEALDSTVNTNGVFFGQTSFELSRAQLLWLISVISHGETVPVNMHPLRLGTWMAYFSTPEDAARVMEVDNKVLFDHTGVWFAEDNGELDELSAYVAEWKAKCTSQTRLPKDAMVVRP